MPDYYKTSLQEIVVEQEDYRLRIWDQFYIELCKKFCWYDSYQQMYLCVFLEVLKNQL